MAGFTRKNTQQENYCSMKENVLEDTDNLLIDAIHCIIDTSAEALTEYQLISTLNQQGWELTTNASDSLGLFTSHFLVFNALYQLQEKYWNQYQRYLSVTALKIELLPKIENDSESSCLTHYTNDAALRNYYLDFSQLEAATEVSVKKLLNQFWEHYIATDESVTALNVFSLTHPVSYKEIKQRYRVLAMQTHPDKGGDPEAFQKVNWAFGVLQRVYGK